MPSHQNNEISSISCFIPTRCYARLALSMTRRSKPGKPTHRIAFNFLSKVTCCTNLSRGIKNRWNASVRSPIFVPTGNELLRPPTSQTFPQKRFSADILRLMNCFRYNCGMFTSRSVVTCIPALWRFYPWMRRPARSLRPLAVLRNLVAMPSACFDPGGESI